MSIRSFILAILVGLVSLSCVGMFDIYTVKDNSMFPVLKDGQRILVCNTLKIRIMDRSIKIRPFCLRRSGIYIVDASGYLGCENFKIIKSCLGLSQDTIVYSSDTAFIKKKTLLREIGSSDSLLDEDVFFHEKIEIGKMFIVGHNMKKSIDSRSFGSVQTSDILAKLVLPL